jgi:glycosyltransferase involved in cell wall biosynthesis
VDAGADLQRIRVLTPSVDTELFHPAESATDGVTLGFVGRLEDSKGVRELPRVLRRLPGAVIEAAGSGSVATPGVTRLGELSAAHLAERMRTWRLLLLPSYTEGYPLVGLEAAASGLAVAAVAGVLPREFEQRPGIYVARRPEYPELVARLLSEPRQRYDYNWVPSHDDAARMWEELFESLPPWRPRQMPLTSRWGRLRRARPPRKLARRLLRRA